MIEVRFHGRGGQGAVTADELLAQALISTMMLMEMGIGSIPHPSQDGRSSELK